MNLHASHSSSRLPQWRLYSRLCLLCSVLLLLFGLSVGAKLAWGTEQNRVASLQVRSDPSGVYIDAYMSLTLSPALREALDKGVALNFVISVEVKRGRWYWFDAIDVQKSRIVRLSYQPLLQRYRVTIDGGLSQSFDTLPEALNLVGNVAQWRIADESILEDTEKQRLIFTFELDQKQLPRLFQISLVNQDEWYLKLSQEMDLSVLQQEGE